MYKNEYDKLQKLPQYLLFYGNKYYLKEYESKILEKFKNENILKLYYDEYDFETAKTHLQENSLFGGKSILVLKHNKIPSDLEKLTKYTNDSHLFFFYYGDKKPTVFGKNFVRFFEPGMRDLMITVAEYERKYSVKLSNEAKQYLINSVDPLFLDKEIEKLSLYKEEIMLEDVKKLVFEYKEENFEELFILMLEGKDFTDMLDSILERIDYRRIIPALIRYIKDLYTYYLFIKTTGNANLEKLLGYRLPKHIEQKRVELAIKLKEKEYYNLLNFLMGKELEMRNSEKNKETVFWEVMSFMKLFKSF